MAFVSEEIRKEDEEYFNSIGFTQLATDEPVCPFWWVIDREREIIMTSRGRVIGEIIKGYQIYYKKELINIELIEQGSGDCYKKNVTIHYKINSVQIPKRLIDKGVAVEEVKDLIREMFMAAGSFGHEPEKTMETTVTIETEPVVV